MKNFILPLVLVSFLISCGSLQNAGYGMLAGALSGDGTTTVFLGDNDPELIADSLPVIMKLYDLLAEQDPENDALLAASGQIFIMYANAFVQTPAGQLPDEDYRKQGFMLQRASKLYTRGIDSITTALDLRYEGFGDAYHGDGLATFLLEFDPEDVEDLYWLAAGQLGRFSCDPLDLELGAEIYKSIAILYRLLEITPPEMEGAVHSLLVSVNASMPLAMVIKAALSYPDVTGFFLENYYTEELEQSNLRARYHYEKAQTLSEGRDAGSRISLATSLSVHNQDLDEYMTLLNEVLELDPDEDPDTRLMITVYRQNARWLIDHRENFFLVDF